MLPGYYYDCSWGSWSDIVKATVMLFSSSW
jgi:hypothetical protein